MSTTPCPDCNNINRHKDGCAYGKLEAELLAAKRTCGEQRQLIRSLFYAAEFYAADNGYRLNKLLHATDNGKEVLVELDQRDALKQANAELAASEARLRETIKSTADWRNKSYNTSNEYFAAMETKVSELEGLLSTPPSTALAEYMKPWREFVEGCLPRLSNRDEPDVKLRDQARELLKAK